MTEQEKKAAWLKANEREELVAAVNGTYSSSNFPGSKGWQKHQAAKAALKAYDEKNK